MEVTDETGFKGGGEEVPAVQDPGLYAAVEAYNGREEGAAAFPEQPEPKKAKKEPAWHQYTNADKDGHSKKRVCKEHGCNCIIHHGLSQWVEHILGVASGEKKTIKKCVSPGIEATMEAERYRDSKASVDRPKVERVRRTPVTSVNACVVERLISDSSACVLRPIEFFVAWSGVVTLAFSGFPQPLLSIKEKLSLEHSIPPEKPGSVWPKTSLGCLRDGKRLTPEQLRHVHRICKEEELNLVGTTLAINELSVVMFECRSLERLLAHEVVPFGLEAVDSDPPESEAARVRCVLDEFSEERLDTYWTDVARDGNRESHYREVALGATLVHFLGLQKPPAVNALIARLEAEIPETFAWFNERSLHVTVRGLIGA